MTWARGVRSLLLSSLVLACAPARLPTSPVPASFPTGPGIVSVGVGRADITPPPGVSTFGHGPDARVSNGIWTRLYCRAFVFEKHAAPAEKQGPGLLAIVPCDLPAMSMLLQRRAAEVLNERGIPIPAQRLMLLATHTHAGPGHYFEGRAYTGMGSSQLPGYDERMVEFLACGVADAVEAAYRARKPAKLRWVHNTVRDLTRNRDLSAFLRNPKPAWVEGCASDVPEECAIDPALSVLQIERNEDAKPGCPIGWLTFFAMHPTVVPNTNRLLGGDAFGVASRVIEAHLRQVAKRLGPECPGDPLAGIVNTNEGDLVPRWTSGSIDEAIAIGHTLGQRAISAVDAEPVDKTPFDAAPSLAAGYVDVDMRLNGFGLGGATTCDEAELGIVAAMGASDHPTFLEALRGDMDPKDRSRTDCQKPKRGFPSLLTSATTGEKNFPSIVPVANALVGDEIITFVPAELTMMTGRAVDAAAVEGYGRLPPGDMPHAVVAGLANAYIQYVTTPEEYAVQGYEGASTLFGPNSEPLLVNVARALAQRLHDPSVSVPGKFNVARPVPYWLGPARDRMPTSTDDPSLADLDWQRAPVRLCSIPNARPRAVCFLWTDGAPGVVGITEGPWIGLVAASPPQSRPEIPASELPTEVSPIPPGVIVLDDRGTAFRVRIHHRAGDAWLWSALVQPSTDEWTLLARWGRLQIRAELGQKRELSSWSFNAQQPPPPCTVETQRQCGM